MIRKKCFKTKFKNVKIIKLFILLTICNNLTAQNFNPDSLSQLKKRFSFANMYLGIEGLGTSSGSLPFLNRSNAVENTTFSGYFTPRLIWGGTHFWGYADLCVAFPLIGYNETTAAQLSSVKYRLGVETAVKVYPYRLRTGTIRPYAGMAWNISEFQQTQKEAYTGVTLSKNTTPIVAGFSYRGKRMIFEGGMQYFFKNQYKYPVNRTTNGNLQLPQFAFTIGGKYLLETTYKRGDDIKKRMAVLEKYHKYSAFYVGVGPSASIGIPTFSEYDKVNYPFFKNHRRYLGILADLTLGYYFAKPNMNVGLSYRGMGDSYQGFGVQHVHRRKSAMVEAYKFLGDYHGFAPYLGVTASYESLFFATRDLAVNNSWSKYSATKPALGVIFGWDIKPTKAESWLLRTNLRYAPVSMTVENKKVAYDYIEFNFIQLVLFPERMIAQYKERKK
jgi:hypothetical protein